MVNDTLECVRLERSTDDDMDHGFGEETGNLKERGLTVSKWISLERLQTPNGCVSVLRENRRLKALMKDSTSIATFQLELVL